MAPNRKSRLRSESVDARDGAAAATTSRPSHPVIARRSLLCGLGAAAIALPVPRHCAAQAGQRRMPVVAYVSPGASASPLTDVFTQAMRDLGYIDGQTVSIQYRFWAGDAARLSDIMTEAVGRNVDVILAGDTRSARAAKQATRTIPIIAMSSDPLDEGLVESLAHPEGNVTGFSFFATPTTGKLLEVLKETLPGLSRLGVIDEPELATNSTYLALVKAAAASLNITLYTEHVRTASDFKTRIRCLRQGTRSGGHGLRSRVGLCPSKDGDRSCARTATASRWRSAGQREGRCAHCVFRQSRGDLGAGGNVR